MDWNEDGGDQDPWGRRNRGSQGRSQGSGGSGGGGSGGPMRFLRLGSGGGLATGPLVFLIVIIVIAYVVLGLYQLDQSERGVVLRFGKLQEEVLLPGLNWQPPII